MDRTLVTNCLYACCLAALSAGAAAPARAQESRATSAQDSVRVVDEEAGPDSAQVEAEKRKRDPKFRVEFNVPIEVLFTMVRLWEGRAPGNGYEAEVDSAFAAFTRHGGVRTVGELLGRGARLESLVGTLICRGPLPELRAEYPYWVPDSSAVGTTDEDRRRLISAVRGFYRDAKFQQFWDLHWQPPGDGVPAGRASVEDSAQAVPPEPLWTRGFEVLEDSLYVLLHAEMAQEPHQLYYGSRGNSTYWFIPTLQSPSDTVLAARSYDREILVWVSPLSPDSVCLEDRARLDRLRARQLGIAVVEPLAEWLWPYLAEYRFLFDYLMRGRGRLGLWDSWGQCFAEHLRRAVDARVILAAEGEAAAEAYVKARVEEGYGLLPILYDGLGAYEQDRRRYLSLPDFCPRLVSEFENVRAEVASRDAAFGVLTRPVEGELVVTRVFEGLAAARAGVAVGDTLTRVDGTPVGPGTDLEAIARDRGIGGRLEVETRRDGRTEERVFLLGADLINYRFFRAGGD